MRGRGYQALCNKWRMKMMNLVGREKIGEGSDEDEDYPIPASGENMDLATPLYMMLSDGSGSTRENEVVQGAKYASSALLKEAVKLWSLSLKKEFKVVKSTQSIEVPKYNRNLTAALVANEMYGRILDAPHFEPKQIIREMELQHQYTISYAKAYRAKQKVFEMRFGTYEDSYDNLPRMLATIAQRNPGTYFDVMHFPNPEGGHYATAIGVDGNNQVLPVAFAFVENENADSWYWFLERVKTNVVSLRSNVCLISDRHSGILDAIEKLKHGNGASPPLWPDVHSRWCMMHLAANFYDHFKNNDLQDLFKSLCSQNQQRNFNAIWKLLDELTAKHQTATSSASSSARTAKPFSQWIQNKPKEKWALLYDTNGRRYGIMTTNHAEYYNMVMRSSRGLPLVGVVEFILYGCAKYFRERYISISADLSNAYVLFGRTITKYMETKTDKAQIHNARLLGTRENRFEVSCRDRSCRGVRRERTVQETVIGNDGMAEEPPTPELLDPVVDSGHRSYMSAVEHKHLATFQCRPPKEYLELDNRWLQRLRGAGLLTFCRLVEGGPIGRHGRGRPRLMIDNSLITALVDRWRPETHTFHMPCGEMAPTLQDVSYLLGLPIAGTAVGPRVVPASWKDDLEIRFAGVDRLDDLGALEPHPNARGPAKAWLLRFKATDPHPDTDDESVRRSPEAYLLWPFGFIMFKNGTSNSSTRYSYPMRERLRMHPRIFVPLWSWGSAVLAATYRGLCDACSKDESNTRFQGCALLLQLWSYERLAVGRPIVDHRGYEAQYYGQHDDDGPTMGTLWVCPHERTWANEQARRTYPSFVVALDRFVAEDVIWEPYSAAAVGSRAPYGLSSMCTSNETLWYTTASLVYDIYIEPHCPHRAMRQFGYAQQFPVPRVIDRVTPQDHRLSRLGQPYSGTWVTKVEPYVQAWDNAHQNVVHPVAPHTDWWYETFLTWYRPRTRCHVTYADTQPVPHESSSTDAYARHRDEALAGAMQICCQLQSNTNDALQRHPLAHTCHRWIPHRRPTRRCIRLHKHVTPMDPPSMSYTPMGTSLRPRRPCRTQPMGPATSMSFTPIRPQTTGFNLFEGVQDHQVNFSDLEHDQHDIIGASQLEGAPLFPTQEATQTPVEQIRPHRVHRSPDPLMYSVGHVHAQQRPKRGRSRRDG
ncbi:hypothetical protein U9M48_037044 [Paspalum notatum var. saurae]|uniref:Uncharacterized protein n=1 Tax=Paspalum notatum var. saurae TaxID=547442 RepID=A0AAQ3XAN5_PASNO